MNLRYIDWIWNVTGSLALAPGQSNDDAFARLDPLFREPGTSHERTSDTLVFTKKDQAAQDKMSVFDSGVLRIEPDEAGPVLRYRLTSRALLFCFLLPVLFVGIALLTPLVAKPPKPSEDAAADRAGKVDKAGKVVAGTAGKVVADKTTIGKTKAGNAAAAVKKPAAKKAEVPMNPIDKFLGAPAPEKKDADKPEGRKKKPSSTPAYVFAGIFAFLFIAGRILEDWLVKTLFRKKLAGA